MSTNLKPLLDFPGYAIRADGTVWTCRVRGAAPGSHSGGSCITNVWRQLKPKVNKGAKYPLFSLCKDKKVYYKRLHRLMAETFIPNPSNHPLVLHRDGNKLNNTIENLYWGTYTDNSLDRYKHERERLNNTLIKTI